MVQFLIIRFPTAEQLGFIQPDRIRVAEWNEERHLNWLSQAKLTVDVKANDFRSRHKPPAKAFDFLASGLPVLTNRGSSTDLEMQFRGLRPLYTDAWSFHDSAFEQHNRQRNAVVIRNAASAEHVWTHVRQYLTELLEQRQVARSVE